MPNLRSRFSTDDAQPPHPSEISLSLPSGCFCIHSISFSVMIFLLTGCPRTRASDGENLTAERGTSWSQGNIPTAFADCSAGRRCSSCLVAQPTVLYPNAATPVDAAAPSNGERSVGGLDGRTGNQLPAGHILTASVGCSSGLGNDLPASLCKPIAFYPNTPPPYPMVENQSDGGESAWSRSISR